MPSRRRANHAETCPSGPAIFDNPSGTQTAHGMLDMPSKDARAKAFARWDVNGNGMLSLAEIGKVSPLPPAPTSKLPPPHPLRPAHLLLAGAEGGGVGLGGGAATGGGAGAGWGADAAAALGDPGGAARGEPGHPEARARDPRARARAAPACGSLRVRGHGRAGSGAGGGGRAGCGGAGEPAGRPRERSDDKEEEVSRVSAAACRAEACAACPSSQRSHWRARGAIGTVSTPDGAAPGAAPGTIPRPPAAPRRRGRSPAVRAPACRGAPSGAWRAAGPT